MAFKTVFRSSPKTADGLSQAAREAIVDLLHYCMYADKHIAAREDEFIEATARKLDWDPSISYESYEAKSSGAVTRALSDQTVRREFLQSLKTRLGDARERQLALDLANQLMKVDGTKSESESAVLTELKALLR